MKPSSFRRRPLKCARSRWPAPSHSADDLFARGFALWLRAFTGQNASETELRTALIEAIQHLDRAVAFSPHHLESLSLSAVVRRWLAALSTGPDRTRFSVEAEALAIRAQRAAGERLTNA